jgi:type II secretory pathway component GspD/PulD (secretin)
MMRLWFVLLLAWSFSAQAAAPAPSFELDAVPLSDVVRLVYLQAYPKTAYFADPQVLLDRRPVSFRYDPKDGDFRAFFGAFLRSLGYGLEPKAGADLIRPLPAESHLSVVEDPGQEVFVYKPKYRDGAQLVEMLTPLFNGRFTSQRNMNISTPKNPAPTANAAPGAASPAVVAPPGSLLDQANRKNDVLIFSGTPREVAALRKLLAEVDVDVGQVMVSGALYEVQTTDHEASALQVAAGLLQGRFQFNLGAAQLADNFVSLKNSSVSLIMQALDSDSRFKVLSSPSLRVASGSSAALVVGQDVPVLGAITYPQGGASPVQSVDYRSSGVLFSISPEVRESSISVKVDQQVSSFMQTTTGVNNSPTLTKRQLTTNVNLADGDVVVIGGLREDKDSEASSGLNFLPSLFKSKSSDKNHSEILLFLQLRRI